MPPPPPAHPPSQPAEQDSSGNASGSASIAARFPPMPRLGARAPDPANTRVLLRSLEDLRDSLSVRVEQLSLAVERLRGQASELERAVSTGSSLSPTFGRQGSSGSSQIDPLPLPSLPRRTVLAPRVTRTTSTTVSHVDDPIEALTQSLGGMTMQPIAARVLPSDNRGRTPTNLAAIASQPKPAIVRSPAASTELEQPDEHEHDPQVNRATARRLAETIMHLSPAEWSPAEPAEPAHTPASPNDETGPAPPTLSPSQWEWFFHGPSSPPTNATTPLIRPPPGLTTRGMMVRERQGVPLDLGDGRHDRDAREAERLDRAIARSQRRHDESQREFHAAWDHERSRALHAGRVPNEFSTARADALRRHVDNSHRLWHLMYQRGRLSSRVADRLEHDVDVPEAPLVVDAVRPITTAPAAPPPFLRRGGGPLRPRRSRWPPTAAGVLGINSTSPLNIGSAAGVPASPPPRPSQIDIVDIERGWIERIENERQGTVLRPTPDQSEYDYYRDYLYEARQRMRQRSAGDGVRDGERETPSDVVSDVDADESWTEPHLSMLERLSRIRAEGREVSQRAHNHRHALRGVSPAPAPDTGDDIPFHPLAPLQTWRRDDSEPASPAVMLELDNMPWLEGRAEVLAIIEESRGRVHDVARSLSPEALAEGRPGMRRVLEGLERMLSRNTLAPDIRARLERLATRERDLLGEAGDDVRGGDTASDGASDDGHDSDADVLERIERARERVRALSRMSRDLAAVRAGMLLGDERRDADRGRRSSDTETVVPSDWRPDLSRPGDYTLARDDDDDDDDFEEDIEDSGGVRAGGSTAETAAEPPVPPPASRLAGDTSSAPSVAPPSVASEGIDSAASDTDSLSASSFLATPSSRSRAPTLRPPFGGAPATSATMADEDKNETGALHADAWPDVPARRRPRPYVSLLDL